MPEARCPNTIHSNYVTDHRCQRERGHGGDCLFGAHATGSRAAKIKAVEQILGDTYGRMLPLVDYHYPTAEQIVDAIGSDVHGVPGESVIPPATEWDDA